MQKRRLHDNKVTKYDPAFERTREMDSRKPKPFSCLRGVSRGACLALQIDDDLTHRGTTSEVFSFYLTHQRIIKRFAHSVQEWVI